MRYSPLQTPTSPDLTYARVAGLTLILYILSGIMSMALGSDSQWVEILTLVQSFSALALGATLYALTYEQGPILALFALLCRVAEAIQYGESAIYFSVGSLMFTWLLLNGKRIPVMLAWLGLIASALLVIILPLQLAGLFGGSLGWSVSLTWLVWLPMLMFELALAVWFIFKGVRMPVKIKIANAIG